MIPVLTSVVGALGTLISGMFGLKNKQSDVIQQAIGTLDGVAQADKDAAFASAQAITAVYQYGSPYEKSWRPTLMYFCMGILALRWIWGYHPPGMTPDELNHIYNFLYMGIGGYTVLRSIDKWMMGFQIGKLLTNFISKKLL